jgi:GTP-binding protein Era
VLREVDLVAWMVDAGGVRAEDRVVAETLRPLRVPVVLVVNKVDGAAARQVEAVAREAQALLPVAGTYRISAQTGLGVDVLGAGLIARLPEGPRYYPEEMLTDQPEQFLIREFIREQAIHHTRQEVPHAVAVEIEEFSDRPDGTVYIRATVHVEKPSQKKILIGRGGQKLRAIGAAARPGAEALLGRKVFLDLWVAVTPDWREKPALIRGFYPE